MAISASLRKSLGVLLLLAPLGYASVLLWQEQTWRTRLAVVERLPVPAKPVVEDRLAFDAGSIASVLGLAARDSLARSSEALVLRASFVSTTGDSLALLSGAGGERTYRVGDALPGGSVLRRVEVAQVVLWRNGREELLRIELPDKRSLLPLESDVRSLPGELSLVYLQPTTDGGQSD